MKNKVISFVLVVLLLVCTSSAFGASPSPSPSKGAKPTPSAKPSVNASPAPIVEAIAPEVEAEAAIVMNQATGDILYSKNIDKKEFPASTTKILTAIIAIEKGNLADVVTASQKAVSSIERGSSNMGIMVGEQMTLKDLVYSMLIYSANDAAAVIAEHIGGSLEGFSNIMNNRAIELGAKNSHFITPNGLHDENHYTTAYDLAVITRYAMTNPVFAEIVKTPRYTMPPTNKYTKERIMPTTNHLISKTRRTGYFYPYAIGVKTGYTTKSNNCLVSAAKKDDVQLVSVLLNVKNGTKLFSFTNTIDLFNYVFNNFAYQGIAKKDSIITEAKVRLASGKDYVALSSTSDVGALLPKNFDKSKLKNVITLNNSITAPIKKGDKLGSISYSYNEKNIATADLVAFNNVKRGFLPALGFYSMNIIKSPFFYIPIIIVALFLLYINIMKIKGSKKRRERMTYRQNNKF